GREHHVRRHRRADEEVDVLRRNSGVVERGACGRKGDVGECLLGRCDPPLPNPRPLADPLVGGLDELGELGVGHDLCRHVDAEPRDANTHALRGAEHQRSTANVSVPRAASASPTCAVAFPRPMGPRIVSISQASVSTSPGSTMRLNRQSSMPAKNAIFPWFSSSTRTAIAPVWAIASTMRTPGITGRSGKCPRNHQSSAFTLLRATTRDPGSSSVTSSMRRKGSRWGRIDSMTSFPKGTAGGCTRRVYWPDPELPLPDADRRHARVPARIPGHDTHTRRRTVPGNAHLSRLHDLPAQWPAVDHEGQHGRLAHVDRELLSRNDQHARSG